VHGVAASSSSSDQVMPQGFLAVPDVSLLQLFDSQPFVAM
jgi:hypothetical protein